MLFRYVIVINFLVLIILKCQAAKKEIFELPEVRKQFVNNIDFKKAEFNKDSHLYSQYFDTSVLTYSISWNEKGSVSSESLQKNEDVEIFIYQDGELSMKAKMKRHAFKPYYKEDIAESIEQTEDSIFYYLKSK
ncbi:hypothetical protein [Leptospira neocaledonica]|uniref:Uncharacterized protein n=1 Tax=Leptospira neocaledonica TaxID=2023192 RepID=A0A2N0A2K5_9LEPT|nr:hypothetical protein [Leptospira neocaledonica]PJZ78549.1 hypothetical protein CH365_04390 [Leptospira neocaledonica]